MLEKEKAAVAVLMTLLVSSVTSQSASCQTVCFCLADSAVCESGDLDNIPNDLSPYLTRLQLKDNNIMYVSNMEHYNRLEYLDLSENAIVQIKSDSFSESYELLLLNLDHNKLGSISNYDLHGLIRLSSLILAHNEIDNISANAFKDCKNLQILDLSSNKIRDLNVETFRGEVRDTLRELDLSHNQLETVPSRALHTISHLTVLDLSENHIQELYSEDFNGISEGLQDLKLSGCGVHTIRSDAFKGLSFLLRLDLSNNGLYQVPSHSFQHLPMLEHLEIGRNKIKTFRNSDFDFLKNLKSISVEGCRESLVLENGLFRENTNLETIHIKCPKLKTLPAQLDLKHLPVLTKLSFHGSGLSSLPKNMFNYEDLHILDLSANPLKCDCSLLFIHHLLSLPQPVIVTGVCSEPERLQNRNFPELSEDDLLCEGSPVDTNFTIIITSVIIILFVLLIAIAIFCLRRKSWSLSELLHRRKRPKKKLSRTFTGNKSEIRVVQNKSLAGSDAGFLQLTTSLCPDYSNMETLDPNDNKSEHLYTELSEVVVRETVPSYHIPVTNVQCPDVKISEI